jgi:glyoxylase-like metal-dependent hydrolase (beta-lactamase superfamily II)
MIFTQPADGVLRMGTPIFNWYLVIDDDGVTVVDAGAPAHRSQLEPGLAQLGRSLEDVRAVILTHGDGDHRGFAGRLQSERGVPVHVHSADAEMSRTGKNRPREAGMVPYLRHPMAWKTIAGFARGGRPISVPNATEFEDAAVLEVPGHPRVIHAPGHSPGCVAFHFDRHGALIVGDVLFDLNLLPGRRGPQIGPAAFNTSSDQALESLGKLEGVQADVVLFGHGDPWTAGVDAAITAARAAGKS